MNTSTPLDPRSLAHRLTTVGHALHHRLFAQLRDSGIHPKTALLLSAVDGRVDVPWITARLARGGKRLDALLAQGWIARGDEGWTLTDEGRAVLDQVDAARAALLAEVPTEELERLSTALDAVAAAVGLDEGDGEDRRGFGPAAPGADRGFGPFGRGFGPGMRGFGPRFGPGAHGFGPREYGFADGDAGHGEGGFTHDGGSTDAGHAPAGAPGRGAHGRGCDPRHDGGGHDRGHRRGHRHDDPRSAQRAYERGFDAGFSRGREASASGDASASA